MSWAYMLEHFDDNKFKKVFTKLYRKLFVLEGVKHLPPRFSLAFKDLSLTLGIDEKEFVSPSSSY